MAESTGPYYKFLDRDGRAPYSGFAWPRAQGKRHGKWVKVEGPLVVCANGIHAAAPSDVIRWTDAEMWEIEFSGEFHSADQKVYGRQARLVRRIIAWDETSARLLAADIAETALHLFESERPDDTRPRYAIEAARAFARGEIDAAAGDAAGAAARDAAGDAAGDAAHLLYSRMLLDRVGEHEAANTIRVPAPHGGSR